MAKLFSHHDHLHVHAIFGALVLGHFLWRLVQLLRYGTSFPNHETGSNESKEFQTVGVLLHLVLALLSLQFRLPKKRNFSTPLIWPEYRWHSILFSARHCVGTLMSIWGLWPQNNIVMEIFAKLLLILGVSHTAAFVTSYYKEDSKEKKEGTIKAMPYPKWVSPEQKALMKLSYARLQFIAAASSIVGDPTAAFWPLFAIQGAAFFMTLCRKGIISTLTWHRFYAFSLMMNGPIHTYMIARRMVLGKVSYFGLLAFFLVPRLRFDFGFSAVQCWTVAVVAMVLGWSYLEEFLDGQVPWWVWFMLNLRSCYPRSYGCWRGIDRSNPYLAFLFTSFTAVSFLTVRYSQTRAEAPIS